MLVLTRKLGETFVIGDNITVTVVKVQGNQVRLAIDAPANVRILREELLPGQGQEEDPDLRVKPAEWLTDVPHVVTKR